MKIKMLAIGLILTNVFFSPSQLLAVPAAPLLPAPDIQIGIVAAVRGVVKVSSQEKVGKVIASGESIYLGDEISTDGQGNLQILLLDETIFTIGPNSAMVIDKFIYNPASHDGEVKAKIVKGVFRFVTGKIGQKSPKQVEVDLPSGTIGIRGTIVAGEVAGKKSTIILFGPGENNNTRHRTGSFVLTNRQDGKTNETLVNKTGFGASIEGEGFAPTKPFRVPADQMARVAAALSPISGADSGSQPIASSQPENPADNKQSATEQSGQDKAQGQKFASQAGLIGKVMQTLDDESGEAAQNITEGAGFKFTDGPTSRNQLQAFAQSMGGGVHHFTKTGVSLSTPGGTADFSIDIDFGSRTVGGGSSSVTGSLTGSSDTFTFQLPALGFGFGDENAAFQFKGIANSNGTSTCASTGCATADISLGIDNVNGGFANGGHVGISVYDSGGSLSSGGNGVAAAVDGATV